MSTSSSSAIPLSTSPQTRTSLSSSLPGRLSSPALSHTRTPTPTQNNIATTTRRRTPSSHLHSSLFDNGATSHHTYPHHHHHHHRMSSHPLSYLPPTTPGGDEKHKEHVRVSFEWRIDGLAWLAEHVEQGGADGWALEGEMEHPEGLPEVLRRGVVVGEGWYKLDIARTIPAPHSPKSTVAEISNTIASAPTSPPATLSLYIASLSLSHTALEDYAYSTSLFVGIRSLCPPPGTQHAETRWVWHHAAEWEFSRETEYFEVELPRLSALLGDREVAAGDGFGLCVMIDTPGGSADHPNSKVGWAPPGEVTVSSEVVRGLQGMVDHPTGDVRFVCLEHRFEEQGGQPDTESESDKFIASLSLSSSAGKGFTADSEEAAPTTTPARRLVSRKRILYAHSAILKARSEYFADLLTCGFAESGDHACSPPRHSEDRGTTTILVDDASYSTVYHLLSWIYTGALRFAPRLGGDEVRALMAEQQLDRGAVTRLLSARYGHGGVSQWAFRCVEEDGGGSEMGDLESVSGRTVRSGASSVGTSASHRRTGLSPPPPVPKAGGAGGLRASSGSGSGSTTHRPRASPSSTTTTTATTTSASSPATSTTRTPSSKPKAPSSAASATATPSSTTPSSTAIATAPTALAQQTSPRYRRALEEPDPHAHPVAREQVADGSALAVYMLSHRYRLAGVMELARGCVMEGLGGGGSMSVLLATYRYEELHAEVLDYIVEHWPTVQASADFLKCIQEVSAGVWGEAGGLVLHGLFRRL